MLKTCIIGASGYTGAELIRLLLSHPHFQVNEIFVSASSRDAHKPISQLYPNLCGLTDAVLTPLDDTELSRLAQQYDAIFLATPHEASHQWVPSLAAGNAKVYDLSGAFRIKDSDVFFEYYGFEHTAKSTLQSAVYGLAEWHEDAIKSAKVVAVPGCYPTASLTALKPLITEKLLDNEHFPIINAVSGVSGAGRKASMTNSFCEVSLQAYGVLGHRHQPEISQELNTPVIFTPHLGNFKRGILATVTVKVSRGVDAKAIDTCYQNAYQNKPVVRLLDHFPKLQNVVNSPFCDLHYKFDASSGYLVIGSAIDNLLKGAASQAVQCANIGFGFASECGLLTEVHP